ncbi:serine hydrolase [Psychrobacillus sp. FJAT-21963]|uniref:serine hydrolase domain-containing protein n=1 Tax=Psychrobacillus sp. FJAT-21963 TaxID=1712028 RepID=UPI0009ECAA1D|nr:serine hydrolase [Psychrobacillus sp. FJAT-21963]
MIDFDYLKREIKKEKVTSLLVYQKGNSIFEYYKNNKQREKVHKMNSCTKSVLSILVGIALEKKHLTSIHLPVYTFFPELFKEQTDSRKLDITIYHLLTMTDGLDFPEFGEWNSFAPMVYHPNIMKFVLERPIIHPVGTYMNYNSGCSHILSAILQKVTNMKTEEFANKYLFKPLGIKEFNWYSDNVNINKGADGLVLKATDMMKIGQLMLQNGVYNNKRIVSEEWIKTSTTPYFKTYELIGYYGMHWWINKLDDKQYFTYENTYHFALGFGGQYIFIYPKEEIVIVITSEIYENSLLPLRIVQKSFLI